METREEYQNMLNAAVDAAMEPVFLSTKADIIDYLKDTYGSKWTGHAAALLSGTTDTKSKAYKHAQRNFQAERLASTPRTAKQKAKWVDFGKKLPPIGKRLPKKGFKVSVNGSLKVSEGRKRTKKGKKGGKMRGDGWAKASFQVKITGTNAVDFANNPNYGQVFAEYFTNFPSNPVTDFTISSLNVEGLE